MSDKRRVSYFYQGEIDFVGFFVRRRGLDLIDDLYRPVPRAVCGILGGVPKSTDTLKGDRVFYASRP